MTTNYWKNSILQNLKKENIVMQDNMARDAGNHFQNIEFQFCNQIWCLKITSRNKFKKIKIQKNVQILPKGYLMVLLFCTKKTQHLNYINWGYATSRCYKYKFLKHSYG